MDTAEQIQYKQEKRRITYYDSDESSSSYSSAGSSSERKLVEKEEPKPDTKPAEKTVEKPKVIPPPPSLDPYVAKLERFELFSTNQCYYLVGCNKQNSAYRVLKMDRTLIERIPSSSPATKDAENEGGSGTNNNKDGRAIGSTSPTFQSANTSGSASTHHTTFPRDSSDPNATAGTMGGGHGAAGGGGSGQNETTTTNTTNAHQTMAGNAHTAKPTLRPLSDFLTEDVNVYSQEEIKDVLDMINDGNRIASTKDKKSSGGGTGGGLRPIVKAYGLVGFIRFLDCYYLTLITRRAKVGNIGDNGIYTVKNTETIPLKPAERRPGADGDGADPSSVLLSMWNRGKRSVGLGLTNREIAELRYQGLYQVVDLTKNFYFSYTYDLTRPLQDNMLATTTQPFPPPPFKDMYAWNYFLTSEFETCLSATTSYHWIMPIIHGAFVQRKVNDYGRYLNIILLARRSRHFAGTRYLKRGVSEQGKVANDVEHEQILHDDSLVSPGIFSSYLQIRGSIPTFWTQESSVTMPKPPIELSRVDPTYTATQFHFADLLQRYSSPILVLDLVKQSEKRQREVRVGNEYRHAIDYINQTIDVPRHKIRYCALDYSHISKHRNLDVSHALNEVSTWAVNQTGFFCSSPKWKIKEGGVVSPFTEEDGEGATRLAAHLGVPIFAMEQNGVLRTNCIDCLDRTNVAQFSAGVEAIGQQLVAMGIRSSGKLEPSSTIVRVLIELYVDIGDSIALQYGGSEAHKKVTAASVAESNITGPIGKHKELLTSIRRYYSNAFTDRLKQDAMNLFLGYYLPYRHSVPLWEMENDYFLHNTRHISSRGTNLSMKSYRRAFGIDWRDDEDEETKNSTLSLTLAQQKLSSSPRSYTQRSGNARRKRSSHRSRKNAQLEKVCNRFKAQNAALSIWWKIALQSNIKQRMWMSAGTKQHHDDIPSRFDRVYQPEKLGQFDRFFARTWITPVRQNHAAQHGAVAGDGLDSIRVISEDFASSQKQAKEKEKASSDTGEIKLKDFVKERGFESRTDASLKSFTEYFATTSVQNSFDYMSHTQAENPPEEYLKYCKPSNEVFDQPQSYNADRVKEFEKALSDYHLDANNVKGIRELAKSAHLGETIVRGEYRGLNRDTSAIEVATAIQEQFNALGCLPTAGQLMVESELKRRGLDTTGVKEAVESGWKAHQTAQIQYREVVEARVNRCQRSELTSVDSLKLYASQFDENTTLTSADQFFLEAKSDRKKDMPMRRQRESSDSEPSLFVQKASRLGIKITAHNTRKASTTPQLYQYEQRHQEVRDGFEQINEDLFSRRDNKFMVFNGAGVDSWTGLEPITKLSHAEEILLSTLT